MSAPTFTITNMVMVRDKATGKVLVEDKIKGLRGIIFPGGHTEDGETVYDRAVREVWEETGLRVKSLVFCGFMRWFNDKTRDTYLTFFYKTDDWTGEMNLGSEEGRVFWVDPNGIENMRLAPSFRQFLPFFMGDEHKEAYCVWNDDMPKNDSDTPWEIIYR